MDMFNVTNIVCNFPREPSEWYIFKSYKALSGWEITAEEIYLQSVSKEMHI